MGEQAAIKELAAAADFEFVHSRGCLINERIGWLCRILYQCDSRPLRPPGLGASDIASEKMPLEKWPLYPIAKSGNTYCVVAQFSALSGLAEPISSYLAYCQRAGTFLSAPIPIPSQETAIQDISAIRSSKQWKDIDWGHGGENWHWNRIMEQTEFETIDN